MTDKLTRCEKCLKLKYEDLPCGFCNNKKEFPDCDCEVCTFIKEKILINKPGGNDE